jgi:hypothetical protein
LPEDAVLRVKQLGLKSDILLQVPTVLLKRTKQSKAFRNGNQLVFMRAISPKTTMSKTTAQAEFVQGKKMAVSTFLKMVQGAALAAGRQVTLLSVSGAASCHTQSPMSFPAGAYLTTALFYVHPKLQ